MRGRSATLVLGLVALAAVLGGCDDGGSVVGTLDAEKLAAVLQAALEPAVATRARSVAQRLVPDGATVAARRLVAL